MGRQPGLPGRGRGGGAAGDCRRAAAPAALPALPGENGVRIGDRDELRPGQLTLESVVECVI